MAIFDGHNDLLLNLWLHHRQDPVTAFFSGIETGHLDYPRMQQGGFSGGLFALFVPPQGISPAWRHNTPASRGSRSTFSGSS